MWMKLLTMQSEKELLRLISKVEKTLFVFSKWKQTYNLIIIVRFCHRWSQSYFYSRCVVLLLIYIESSIYSEPTIAKFFGYQIWRLPEMMFSFICNIIFKSKRFTAFVFVFMQTQNGIGTTPNDETSLQEMIRVIISCSNLSTDVADAFVKIKPYLQRHLESMDVK